MRGKLKRGVPDLMLPGITPADAGKTLKLFMFVYSFQDHPRGCGENLPIARKYA